MRSAALLALLLLAGPAVAQDRACRAVVNGEDLVIAPGAILAAPETSLRERVGRWPGSAWNRLWGSPTACDSETLIAFLSGLEGLPEAETALLCLASLPDGGYLLVPGDRDFRGRCQRTLCDRIAMAAEDGFAATARLQEYATGTRPEDPGQSLAAMAQASGALLLSGESSLIGAILAPEGGTLARALARPEIAAATAVTVMAASGAVWLCRD